MPHPPKPKPIEGQTAKAVGPATPLFALLADFRREGKSYMEKSNRGTHNADYYAGKSWAYDAAADSLEAILEANVSDQIREE